jgi:hypothetical protein
MDKVEKRLYTPVVLRTGFMHSYRRTISLLLFVIALEAVFWTLAGFWPWFDELGLVRWGLIVILAIVVPIGTSTIRDIVAGYAALFGVFDEKTEESLKLYRSLNRPSSETQKGVHRLFKDDDTYAAFQEGIRQAVFDKTTDIVVIVTIISTSAFVLYNTVYEKIILGASASVYPLSILEIVIDAYATIFIIAALSFILMFGVGYFYVLYRLGGSRSDLGVWNYVQYLRGAPVTDGSFVSYWRFHDYASTIGRHFSGIAFRIVLLMALGGLAQLLYNVSTSTMVTWILAASPVALSVLVLVVPLNSLHRVLHDAKVAVLRELEEEYDQLTLSFVPRLTGQRHSQTSGRADTADEDLPAKLTSLRGIIEETRQQSTWPVRAPMVLRIIATSLIPIAYFFLEELLRALWLPQ